MPQDYRRKAQLLRAKANGPGVSEEERQTLLAKASELEARYGKAASRPHIQVTMNLPNGEFYDYTWYGSAPCDGEDTGIDDDLWKDPDWIRDTY